MFNWDVMRMESMPFYDKDLKFGVCMIISTGQFAKLLVLEVVFT